jgi:hypothetical protein
MTNTVTQQQIDELLDNATTEEHLFHGGKSLIISYQLENGWTVDGRAAIVDLTGFDLKIGRLVAKQDAVRQLWALEGYLLQNELYERSKITPLKDIVPYKDFLVHFEYQGEEGKKVLFWDRERVILQAAESETGEKVKLSEEELKNFVLDKVKELTKKNAMEVQSLPNELACAEKRVSLTDKYGSYLTTSEYKGERIVNYWDIKNGTLLVEVTFLDSTKQKVVLGDLKEFIEANREVLVKHKV